MKVIIAATLLLGCTTMAVRNVNLPDGSLALEAVCVAGTTVGDCMNLASKTCGGKYSVLNNDQAAQPVHVGFGIVTSASKISLIFKCEGAIQSKIENPEDQPFRNPSIPAEFYEPENSPAS